MSSVPAMAPAIESAPTRSGRSAATTEPNTSSSRITTTGRITSSARCRSVRVTSVKSWLSGMLPTGSISSVSVFTLARSDGYTSGGSTENSSDENAADSPFSSTTASARRPSCEIISAAGTEAS